MSNYFYLLISLCVMGRQVITTLRELQDGIDKEGLVFPSAYTKTALINGMGL